MMNATAWLTQRERIRASDAAALAITVDELMATANSVAVRLVELDRRDAYEHITAAWSSLYDARAFLEKKEGEAA